MSTRRTCDIRVAVRRPPLVVVLLAIVLIALGETSGAVMAQLRDPFQRFARARVAANPAVHGLAGSAEYDTEVAAAAVFTTEAGLSFFHTHAEGLGLIVFFVTSVAATVVPWRPVRGAVYTLMSLGGLFPLGYLVYSFAVLERGRDAGIELAERWVLTPLGGAALVGLAIAVCAIATRWWREPAA